MDQSIQTAIDLINKNSVLSEEEKSALVVKLKEADKKITITEFKLDRTEKVKRTTAILLEETIEELENKRKAVEAQNRELEIEAALERVRARAMAMQTSEESNALIGTVFTELTKLDLVLTRCVILIYEGNERGVRWWMANSETPSTPMNFFVKYADIPFFNEYLKGWYNRELKWQYCLENENKIKTDEFLFNETELSLLPDFVIDGMKAPNRVYLNASFNNFGNLTLATLEPLSEEHFNILLRFAKVFDLTYTRFNDLKQAEAQAREAQIEAALERVRSRSMAMHQTSELQDVIHTVHKELMNLDLSIDGGSFVTINEEVGPDLRCWGSGGTANTSEEVVVPHFNLPFVINLVNGIKKRQGFFTEKFSQEQKKEFFTKLFECKPWSDLSGDYKKQTLSSPGGYTRSVAVSKHTSIFIINHVGRKFTDAENDILKRFAKVFEQTYTRFLDLQKAEAQAREARIQLALERVRARTMAMQHSDELAEASLLLDKQVRALGIPTRGCGFNIYGDNESTEWFSSETGTMPTYKTPREKLFLRYYEEGKKGKPIHIESFAGEACAAHYEYLMTIPIMGDGLKQLKASGGSFPEQQVDHVTYFKYGYLLFITLEPAPEAHDIFIRFAKVFEQTYTRFLDLQQAEAQARESQIQLALERVRARTMAMQKSDELLEAATLMFQQMESLGISTWNCSFNIWTGDKKYAVAWNATKEGFGRPFYSQSSDDVFFEFYTAAQQGKEFFTREIGGKEIEQHYQYLSTVPGVGETIAELKAAGIQLPTFQVFNIAYFAQGYLMFITYKAVPEMHDIFKRFARVFEQTYTRFLDLQKAELQAREAKIEAALERVRSRTLAMQKSNELAETAAVLFKQLILLGIEPNRLYISIMKDNEGETEFWITDEDGSKVSMAYEDNLNNNPSFKKMFDGWKQQKKSLVIDMRGKALKEYLNYLSSIHVPFKGGLAQKRRWQYIAYFSKGFIGMASPDEQPAETLQLLERFAYVFNLTFTRFNDLQIAEAHAVQAEHDLIEIKEARKRAEETLAELQSTQKQLVQSEKMASLGELTAGIAHEIQNPLNFVNNFSEVSKELIDEMRAALENGNKKEADEIANDIIQNLEKINHHGKRADAIVKGMLQHSRKSSGQKEPTDINALCDEYLRLCYHGLRAKDTGLNVNINTDFDTTIQKINLIPQDIGRVILNILTNAFYAVNEKSQRSTVNSQQPLLQEYKPLVSVTTRKITPLQGMGAKVEITVGDNGNGIPQNIIDKIFQPFFTTKPTGQGTGLGLSLAYDIITKEHNGTIKVESKEGEGSIFIIQLPNA